MIIVMVINVARQKIVLIVRITLPFSSMPMPIN